MIIDATEHPGYKWYIVLLKGNNSALGQQISLKGL